MRVLVFTLVLVLAGRLAAPSEATAQYHRLSDAITVGGTLASSESGAERFTGGPEIGGLIELPIGDAYRLRGEIAGGLWHFDGYPHADIAGSRMRRYRLTASVLHSRMPPRPHRRLSAYGGGGAGLYFYRFPARPNGGAWGIHGVMGVEYLLPTVRSRWIAGGEVQIHAMGQPRALGDVTVIPMLSAHVAAVVKYRLP